MQNINLDTLTVSKLNDISIYYDIRGRSGKVKKDLLVLIKAHLKNNNIDISKLDGIDKITLFHVSPYAKFTQDGKLFFQRMITSFLKLLKDKELYHNFYPSYYRTVRELFGKNKMQDVTDFLNRSKLNTRMTDTLLNYNSVANFFGSDYDEEMITFIISYLQNILQTLIFYLLHSIPGKIKGSALSLDDINFILENTMARQEWNIFLDNLNEYEKNSKEEKIIRHSTRISNPKIPLDVGFRFR